MSVFLLLQHQVKVDAAILDGLIIHMLPHIHKHFTVIMDNIQTLKM